MTFQELGGIGEFIGGIGVIVSLLYLARQIRDSSRIERLNARYTVSQALLGVFSRLDDDPELNRIWHAVRDQGVEPEGEDRERLGRFLYAYFGQMSLAHGFAEMDPDLWSRYQPLLLRVLQAPAVQSWWSRQREFIAEPLRSEVDSMLREILDA